ncbi:MAG: DEAD/DEAH box helicase [Burkholderiaceae bacterium]|nr:DEAD/DEAH box helicase [Burkholderiaceae bacterium]
MSFRVLLESLGALTAGRHVDVFAFLAQLSAFAALAEDDAEVQQARELCVRVLDQIHDFAGYEAIVQGLLRNVGLFPYLDRGAADIATQLATEVHRPRSMPEGVVFTTKQAEVYRELMAGRNVVLSAPTSFGKSLIIDAVIASGVHDNIVVVVPTLALVDETRRRLMKFGDHYKLITHLSQAPTDRNIFVHTQERVIENANIRNVDFFVIDEFYKLEIDGASDSDSRSVLLNQAFYRWVKRAKQFYMLGPNIDRLPDGFGKNFHCTFIRTDFSTVASETHIVPGGANDSQRLQKLIPELNGPTLVFSGSVKKVRELGRAIAAERGNFKIESNLQETLDWLGENFHPKWGLVETLRRGVGIHHGRVPRAIAQLLVRLFNEGLIDYLVCTSTLIEGVNTAARNVVIADNTINRRKYDFFTFNNIRGRSGRMWKHYVGHVYLFYPPPEQELEFVDVPAFTQSAETPESLLVQLHREDLSPNSAERLNPVWSQRHLSLDTIRANSGVDPRGQIALAKFIHENLDSSAEALSWRGFPRYAQLEASLELAWKYFGTIRTTEVRSPSQLTFKLWSYAKSPRFDEQIRLAVANRQGDDADEAMEGFLDFTRQWVSFRAPRMLNALDRIQNEVLSRNGILPGDYAHYCSLLESLFNSPVVVALDEYGVPVQLAERVVRQLGNPESLDAALAALKSRPSTAFSGLSRFERSLLAPLCSDAQ